MSTTFNNGPYFDDFDPANNFYRVLFKPGYAVQARELNQLQSILQNQISTVGNHLFKKNSIIIPGGIALNNAADMVSISDIEDPSVLIGKTITNKSNFDPTDYSTLGNCITAIVLAYRAATTTAPAALYVKYYKGQDNGRAKFTQSEPLKTVDESLVAFKVDSTIGATLGKVATLSAGTFYTKEIFVDAAQQSVILEVDSTVTTNCNVGLNIIESIVTSDTEDALLDNSIGSPNQYAPGADRFKIDLVLARIDLTTAINDDKFINMMSIDNNTITFLNNKTQYNEIMKMIARRTYDANGNFIIRGLDTSVTRSPNDNYVVVNVSGGKCYLGGYEYEQLVNTPISIAKPRESAQQELIPTQTRYTSDLTYFYIAGGTFLKEIPTEDSLVQFVNTSPAASTFASTAVNTSTNVNNITVTGHKFVTGNAVLYSNGGGTSVTGLTSGTTYYVIRDGVHTIKLATTAANAAANTAIVLSNAGVGFAHSFTKQLTVIGYGVFKDIQYAFGAAGTNDAYKAFFDYIALEKGYTLEDIGGIKSITNSEGAPVLHQVRLSNATGLFTAGNTIQSTTISNQTGLMYYVNLPFAYVVKNTTDDVPVTSTVRDVTTNATANRISTFVTNYSSATIPMIEIDTSTIKTLYNASNVNTTSYSIVRRDEVTSVSAGTFDITISVDTFANFSSSDYFAFITTPGSEQFVDLTGIAAITESSKKLTITVDSGSPMVGKDVWIYSTVNKTNAGEADKTVSESTTVVIPTPSESFIALGHQDIIAIGKIVDGKTAGVNTASWTSNVATVTTSEVHGLVIGNTVVVRGVVSSNNTSAAFSSGYNGKFVVTATPTTDSFRFALTTNPGTYTASTTDIVALPPNITSDTNITSRFTLESGNTSYLTGAGMIKLKKGMTSPQGQIAVQYTYYTLGAGNYISVDSYGLYTSPDLSYIGAIQDIPSPQGPIEARRYIDFRTRTSSYYFKNIGDIVTGTNVLTLRDLNLSLSTLDAVSGATLIGKYIVGPSHLSGATITSVRYNPTTGNTELLLSSNATASVSGTYYIGLNSSSLSLVDTSTEAGGRSFEKPRDSSAISYQYVKFSQKNLMVFIGRDADLLRVDYEEVANRREIQKYLRNENRLPLAYIEMKPYTLTIQDVSLEKFENPVYQMLDIHNIRLRVDRGEYYTALALNRDVHQEIVDASNEDLSQSSRGIWAEDFMNVLDQDYESGDFACTIYESAYVAPGTVTRVIPMEIDTTLNTDSWQRSKTAITLPYTETIAFSSSTASRFNNLNPYNAINWNGKLVLNPSVDNWIDVTAVAGGVSTTQSTSTAGATAASTSTSTSTTTVANIPPAIVVTVPPVVLPAPAPVEVVTEINNLRINWGPDSAGGRHGITFDWKTNLNRTGRVNSDMHLSTQVRTRGYDGVYAKSLINKPYNDAGVKEYLNAGTHFDQRPPSQW